MTKPQDNDRVRVTYEAVYQDMHHGHDRIKVGDTATHYLPEDASIEVVEKMTGPQPGDRVRVTQVAEGVLRDGAPGVQYVESDDGNIAYIRPPGPGGSITVEVINPADDPSNGSEITGHGCSCSPYVLKPDLWQGREEPPPHVTMVMDYEGVIAVRMPSGRWSWSFQESSHDGFPWKVFGGVTMTEFRGSDG